MPPLLDARALSKTYLAGHGRCWAHVQVLSSLSLRVHHGERVIVTGPRHAGKTTLLHCITGLRRPDAGTVRWDVSRGVPYRLCADPADLAAVPPSCAALMELPDDGRRAVHWLELLCRRRETGGGWIVLTSRAGALAALADRVLALEDGALREVTSRPALRVAERS